MRETNIRKYWLAVIGIISIYLLSQCISPQDEQASADLIAGWVFERADVEFTVGDLSLGQYLESSGINGEAARSFKKQLLNKYDTKRLLIRFREDRSYISMIDTDIQDEGEWILEDDILTLLSRVQPKKEYVITSLSANSLKMHFSETLEVEIQVEGENGNVEPVEIDADVSNSFTRAFE